MLDKTRHFYRFFYRQPNSWAAIDKEESAVQGYTARKGNRWYAVIYHGLDPITGREQRSWHAAGASQADAERLAHTLAKELNGRDDEGRSLTFGAYLTQRWLPGKKVELAATTYAGYSGNVRRHILPALGEVKIRRLTPQQIEGFHESKLRPTDGKRPLSPKTVIELHTTIRGALTDAHLKGVINRNVGAVAKRPKLRDVPAVEPRPRDEGQLRIFLVAASGHRLYPAFRLSAATGMRRSEVLGLQWKDIDWERSVISVNRGLVSVGYERELTRCKHVPHAAPLSSTRQPSRFFEPGTTGNAPHNSASSNPKCGGCSRTTPASPHTHTRFRRHSIGWCTALDCPTPGCMTFATPTPRCSSSTASPSKWSANDSRSRPSIVHARHLQTRHARHASRRRPNVRTPHHTRSTTEANFYRHPTVEDPVEPTRKR